ncbi:MAG TPA: metallophosphoesterase family protein [Candidatus Kryptonia bacterium]|nr:metallophosphoesterase family protein [Candidatus Kryptonia bacterium]
MSSRTFVVGDLHGCVDELEVLLEGLALTAGDNVIFLGDYVDRGPASSAVIERLIRLRNEGPACVFLRGNHEDMFLAYMGLGGLYGDAFLVNGGRATLRSYNLEGCERSEVAQRIPPAHREFLQEGLREYEVTGGFLCVHAGINPLRALDQQSAEDLLWIREEFIRNHHRLPYTVLFGHTPTREVLLDLPYKVGLDTGLVYSNKLSCLELHSADLFQVKRGERNLRRASLARAFKALRPRS